MARFDVHRNKGPSKQSIPFVVVVPLVRRSALSAHIASLTEFSQDIAVALDEFLTRSWG